VARKSKTGLDRKWKDLAAAAKQQAEELPHGNEREALLRRARQLETACQVNEWISSPGLRPPT
jgi:hypothetical protein